MIGLLAAAIAKMDGIGNLAGWRWIFILEGIATVLLGALAAVFLPADINSAPFLTDEERVFARKYPKVCVKYIYTDHSFFVVRRFRSADRVASRAPVSDLSQTSEKSGEPDNVVNYEDEQFEWREVIRGTCYKCPVRRATLISE